MEVKSGADQSRFKDIRQYFTASPQQHFGKSLSCEPQVNHKVNMPPWHCGTGTPWIAHPIPVSNNKLSRRRPKRKLQESASVVKENPSDLDDVMVISEPSCSGDATPFRCGAGRVAGVLGHTAAIEDPMYGRSSSTAADIASKNCPEETDKTLAPIFTRKSEGTQRNNCKHRQQRPKPSIITKSNVSLLTKPSVVPDEQNWELKVIESNSGSQRSTTKRKTLTTSSGSSGWREELSESVRETFLEELQESNPVFPVRRIFAALRKKEKQHVHNVECPVLSGAKRSPTSSVPPPPLQNPVGEKRKFPQNEREGSGTVPKRWRPSFEEEEEAVLMVSGSSSEPTKRDSTVVPAKGQPRRSRLSRTHRPRQPRQTESGGLSMAVGDGPMPDQPSLPESDIETQRCIRRDPIIEDVLWTDKYSPQHSGEVIGNSVSVEKLHSWLRKWKLRADCEERRKRILEKEREENSNDSWDCGDFQGETCVEDRQEELCNTMLITGPPGLGKTASVYACAHELGFKVFEVNASSQRNGRHVLTQLKEATQSHQVALQGHAALKPAYLSYYSNASTKSDTLPENTSSPRKVVSSSRKGPGQRSRSAGQRRKGSQAFITLANFFKMKSKAESIFVDAFSTKKQDGQTSLKDLSPDVEEPPTEGQNRRTATSLILFEEVDVIFDVDVGFLSAIKTFMSKTKRPVILTTNDLSFGATFDGNFEGIFFKTPSMVNVCSYLQLLCLAENVRTDPGDITSLLRVTRDDIRRSLLQLQLWVCSGGRQNAALPAPDVQRPPAPDVQRPPAPDVQRPPDPDVQRPPDPDVQRPPDPDVQRPPDPDVQRPASRLPSCVLGCTPSILGLGNNKEAIQDLLNPPKSWTEPEVTRLMDALAESWRRDVPLLYSNLELLLPLPAKAKPSSVYNPEEVTPPGPQGGPKPLDSSVQSQSPERGQANSIRTSRLSRRKGAPVSNSRSATESLKPRRTSLSLKKRIHSRTLSSKAKPKTDRLVSHCLAALADFMDLMSFLDATMPTPDPHTSGPCRPGAFVWTGAELRDGLLDEMREEEQGRWGGWETSVQIQAALEALAFQRCRAGMSDVWAGTITLPVPRHRQSFSFLQTSVCEPSVVQRRHDITRIVLSSRTFSTLGNKRAVTVDYMPFLRSICQSQRNQEREQGQVRGRFPHYFSSIHLGLPKSTVQLLAKDFP